MTLKLKKFKVLFREGVTKKEYSVYAVDNVDNSGRPPQTCIISIQMFTPVLLCCRHSRPTSFQPLAFSFLFHHVVHTRDVAQQYFDLGEADAAPRHSPLTQKLFPLGLAEELPMDHLCEPPSSETAKILLFFK